MFRFDLRSQEGDIKENEPNVAKSLGSKATPTSDKQAVIPTAVGPLMQCDYMNSMYIICLILLENDKPDNIEETCTSDVNHFQRWHRRGNAQLIPDYG